MNKHMIFDNPPSSYDIVDGVDLELRDLFFCHPMIKKAFRCLLWVTLEKRVPFR